MGKWISKQQNSQEPRDKVMKTYRKMVAMKRTRSIDILKEVKAPSDR